MANNPVDINQLRVMAEHFTTVNYPYFEELREAFKLLRLTGCRIQEIFEIERWSIISGYHVQVLPQKGNTNRSIILNPNFDNFLEAIENQYKPFLSRTSFQLQNLFYKINPYGKLYSDTKEITNYFFRYLFIRELYETGLTFQQIADAMGYTSTTSVHNYLNADLTSSNPIPDPNKVQIGNISYRTRKIENLIWIQESLRNIPDLPKFKYVNNDPTTINSFGLLYSPEIFPDLIDLAPAGWRLPTIQDIINLTIYASSIGVAVSNYNNQSLTFWDSILTTTLNILDFRGNGYNDNSTYYLYKNTFLTALSDIDSFGRRHIMNLNNQEFATFNTWTIPDANLFVGLRFVKDSI